MAGCAPTTRRRVTKSGDLTAIPKDARWLPRPGVLSRSSIIASPVFADGRVFVAMGQSPGHGNGPFVDSCDQSQRPGRRHREQAPLDFSRGRSRGGNAHCEKDGLLYVGDLGGTIHCLDAATGAHVWKHETNEAIWGSLLLWPATGFTLGTLKAA